MKTIDIHVAESDLESLLREAAAGEEIIIAQDGMPRARLMPLDVAQKKNNFASTFGSAKGKIRISDDFDDPLPPEVMKDWASD